MKYESLEPVSHEHAETIARGGDAHALSRVAVSIALADDDLDWSTAFLLTLIAHDSATVRGNALLGFGHLARRFRAIASTASVAAAIKAGLADTDAFVRGQADTAADDYGQFIGPLSRKPSGRSVATIFPFMAHPSRRFIIIAAEA